MVIEQSIEQYCQDRAAKHGKEIGTSTRAYIENQKKLQIKKRRIWDTCFGCYNIVMSAFNGLVEDRFVDVKSLLIPNKAVRKEVEAHFPMKKNQTKKTYRKYINGKLREGAKDKEGKQIVPAFPYFNPVVDEAVKNFDEQFFEDWASQSIRNAKSLIQEIVDKSIEATMGKMTILFYSVKNEMDKMRLPDTEIRARVYTLHLLADALEEIHLGFMCVGLVPEWVGITRHNDKFDLLQRINDIAVNKAESPYFDITWKKTMNTAMPFWNVRYITAINSQVCGEWTHKKDGDVTVALRALKMLICSARFMENVAYDGMMEDQNYEKELELINRLGIYGNGEISVTLVHLQCIRMMLEGKSNDEIKHFLTCDDSIVITEDKLVQILLTVEILKRVESGELDIDYYNRYIREFNNKSYKPDKGYEAKITSDTISEFGEGLVNAINVHKAEEAVAKAEEAIKNDPANRLREKFGNVTVQKEKKPKQHPQYFHPKFKKTDEAKPTVPPKVEAALPLTPTPPTPRINRTKWSPAEEDYLVKHHNDPMPDLVKHYWRTEASIRCKITRMKTQGKFNKKNDPQINFDK